MATAQDMYSAIITLREDAVRGRQKAQAADSFMWTYAAVATAATSIAGTFLEISGCQTVNKVVKVRRLGVTGTSTAGTFDMTVNRRSSRATGGTATNLTPTPFDSQDPLGTAQVRLFTAAPTSGTLIGPIRSTKITWAAAGALLPIAPTPAGLELLSALAQPIALRLPSDSLTVDFSAALASSSVDIYIEWTEELIPGEPYPRQ